MRELLIAIVALALVGALRVFVIAPEIREITKALDSAMHIKRPQ